jgi:glycine cleavage system regulatory protein
MPWPESQNNINKPSPVTNISNLNSGVLEMLTPFGTPTSSTTNSLFGQTDNKTGFGQPQGFGQTPSFGPSTVAFGVPNQTNTSNLFGKPTTFGTTTSNASTFSFNPTSTSKPFSVNQAQKPFSQPLLRTTTTQPLRLPALKTPNTIMNLFPTIELTKLGRPGLSFNQTELKIKVIEAVDTLKEALTRVNEMVELLLKIVEANIEAKLKEVRTMLTDKWNVECRMFNTQIEKLNKKILTLETTIESKEKLIDSTTNLFQKRGQTTAGFNTGQPSFSFKQTDSTQASNLVQVSKLNGFRLAPLGTSTSSTSTPGVGQSTLTFGVTNQTNTSSLFSKPPIFGIDSLKRALMNKTIVTDDKLPTKLNITSELEKKVNEAVDKLKEALKRVNEMVEMLLKIAEANMEDKLKEVQTILTGKWNVECRMFNTQIEKLNAKILTLETTMKSKDKLIQRWVILNIKSVKLIMN